MPLLRMMKQLDHFETLFETESLKDEIFIMHFIKK